MRYALTLSLALILVLVIWFIYVHETDVSSVGEVSRRHAAGSVSDAVDRRTTSSASNDSRMKQRWKAILQQQKQRAAVKRQVESMREANASEDEVPPGLSDMDATKQKEVERAAVAQLDAIVKRKPKDERWAEEVNEKARLWASSTKQPAKLTSVECGDTLCRAELLYEDDTNRGAVLMELVRTPPFKNIGYVYSKDPDDPQSVFYFTQDGHTMPELEWPQ